MTTIIYTDGVMYADSRAYSGGKQPVGRKHKLHRLKDGSIVGVSCAKVGEAERFVAWLNANNCAFDPTKNEPFDVQALLVRQNGEVFYLNDSGYPSGPLIGEHFVIGSGEEYAMGALKAGANPRMAIGIAAECDHFTALPVTVLPLHE